MSDLPFNGLTKDNWRGRLAFVLKEKIYQQGSGHLRVKRGPYNTTEQHCCLGVLCEIAGIPAVKKWQSENIYSFLGDDTELPRALAEHLDITTTGNMTQSYETVDEFDEVHLSDALTELNDDTDIGFFGIADALLDDKVEFDPYGI